MFKRVTMIAAAAALAVVLAPSASEAGSHHKREARSGCAITKMLHRARTPRVHHVRKARVHHVRKARVHHVHKVRARKH